MPSDSSVGRGLDDVSQQHLAGAASPGGLGLQRAER